jgi:hypothetical protein
VLGCNIDLFHADPFRRRGKGLAYEPLQRTTLCLGAHEFELTISDLHDDAGAQIGTLVQWQDRSPPADCADGALSGERAGPAFLPLN